jgi:hypothetical protein
MKMHGTRTDDTQVAKTKAEAEVRLSGRGSRGIESAAVVRSVAVQLDSSAPAGDGKRLDLDRAYADQDRKVPGMAPGAATVIRTVMIRENLDCARRLDRSEARQDQQDQQNPAHFIPASGLRRE